MSPLTFLKGRWSWAKQKPLFWVNLLLVVLTGLVVFVYPGPVTAAGPSDFRLRAWAMLLQILGAATVWHDLTGSARIFGKAPLLAGTWGWLRACFGTTHRTVGSLSASMASISGSSRGTQRRTAPADAPLEARVEVLEFNLSRIDSDLSAAFQDIDKNARSHSDRLGEERAAREAAYRALEERLKDSIVGNYAVLAFGAFWVVAGIVLSALAPEIAKTVAGQWAQVWAAL